MEELLFKHKHICLVEDHYNPLGIVRSLGEKGISPIVLLISKKPGLLIKSKYPEELVCFESIKSAFDYMIAHFSNEDYKPFIYNGSDNIALYIDNHYKELKNNFYFCNGRGNLGKYLQKYELTLLAEKCGFMIPKEEYLRRGDFPKELRYPVMTKAATSANGGNWKSETFICQNENELKQAYNSIQSDTILVQEFIEKKNEYCLDGISINSGEEVFIPYGAKYHRFSSKSYGAFMYFEPVNDTELVGKIKNLIKAAGYTGIFCIEFLIGPDNNYYFLEVNFRNSGWSYAFTYGGFNLPYNWAKSTLNNKIDTRDFKPLQYFNAISEREDYVNSVKSGEISFKQWIKDWRNSEVHFLYNANDKKPFSIIKFCLRHYIYTVLRKE